MIVKICGYDVNENSIDDSNGTKEFLIQLFLQKQDQCKEIIVEYVKEDNADGLSLVFNEHSKEWELLEQDLYILSSCPQNEDGEVSNWFLKEILNALSVNDLNYLAEEIENTGLVLQVI